MRNDRKPDLSRLVSLDLSPTEAAMLIGVLEGFKRHTNGALGLPMLTLLDGTIGRMRLQLKQLHWPEGHKAAPYPV